MLLDAFLPDPATDLSAFRRRHAPRCLLKKRIRAQTETDGLAVTAYIVMAYIVMAYIVMDLYSYGPI